MKAVRLVTVTVVAAGLGLGLGLGSVSTPSPDPVEPPQRDAAVQSSELDAVKRQLRVLAREQGLLLDDIDALALDIDDVAQGVSAPPPEPVFAGPEVAVAEMAAEGTRLATWFEEQPADPDWSVSAEDDLLVALSELERTDLSAECMAEACRLELAFTNDVDRDQMMPRVPFLLPWSGER